MPAILILRDLRVFRLSNPLFILLNPRLTPFLVVSNSHEAFRSASPFVFNVDPRAISNRIALKFNVTSAKIRLRKRSESEFFFESKSEAKRKRTSKFFLRSEAKRIRFASPFFAILRKLRKIFLIRILENLRNFFKSSCKGHLTNFHSMSQPGGVPKSVFLQL